MSVTGVVDFWGRCSGTQILYVVFEMTELKNCQARGLAE